MANIKPFKGLRPVKKYASKIASPPYDVINSKEARKYVKNNPISFLHVVKPEIDLPENTDLYSDTVYQKGKENLNMLIEKGYLKRDENPSFYIYRQKMGNHVQTGIVAAASCEEYKKNIIKKHELTREDKEIDRAKHIETLNANTGPVFLTYRAKKQIDDIIEKLTDRKPEYDFTSEDGIQHTLFVISDPDEVSLIIDNFKEISTLYIADGHHRSAAAVRVMEKMKKADKKYSPEKEYNYFLSVIFPHNQMYVMDYNRVVKDLNGNSEAEFLEKLSKIFQISEFSENRPYKPERKGEFGMYLDDKWYRLIIKNEYITDDPVESLDVSILQNNVLSPILGIENPRKDKRIDFIGGIRGLGELERLVNSKEYKVAFALYPTSLDDLLSVADAGKIMPPKSTWFEPKLRSGLVIHELS
ncbi:DUF1015 domain-containing protein [candidate division TA06 bacterium]|uniref:DUF1015 domain-containing protein n=1 Tax=candidate division TA06 bacterium TaxID=2250710 RepID=A0A660SB37_UNCT6|nr:MAG: DUF1015 domain-containing protein [candidate division TA06 bacterium]